MTTKRVLTVLVVSASLALAAAALADKEMKKETPKPSTIKGEIVDMGCYMPHAARGAKHKECATKCIAGGMPMGLLTDKGKLYILTLNHDDPDPYNQCKDLAAEMVEVTGTVSERAGVSAIDVTSVRAAVKK